MTAADGARLCVSSLGDPADPALVLLGGAGCSMDWWDEDLCALLVARGYRVVRPDARDTGASSSWPVGAPGYGATALLSDVVAVLDALEVDRAHVAGVSSGGGLAQRLGLAHRDRVGALTLIATSPVDPRVTGLPGPDPAVSGVEVDAPDPSDPEAAVEAIVEGERPYYGTFDEDRVRAVARRVVARTRDLAASSTNPFAVVDDWTGPDDLGALAGVPTLVVHGAVDPLFPPAHGRALAAAVPGARYLEIEGMGHQYPPESSWPEFVAALSAT